MASNCGTVALTSSTGAKSFNIGMTANWCQVRIRGSGLQASEGFVYGGDQYCYSDPTTGLPVNKAIQVKNTAGTVVIEGTWTSFSGSNVNFNITTNTTGATQSVLLVFGN